MLYQKTAYLTARLCVGVSMLAHGLVRLPKLSGFSHWMVGQFAHSILPETLVRPFSYALPFAELVTGVLLIAGLFTRQGLVLGCGIMMVLIFGSGMIEDWNAIPSQLIHAAFFSVLLASISYNEYSADGWLHKN